MDETPIILSQYFNEARLARTWLASLLCCLPRHSNMWLLYQARIISLRNLVSILRIIYIHHLL